ncbi:(d)CMP kinase [Candidatus Bipolaricaulota bacterium]|nr:(d)CMP kinase [Candidatus Bipolaricaulota bacterium]
MQVTIDGPAGVGKTSVGRKIANRFSLAFIQSGKLYRALAYAKIHDLDPDSLKLNPGDATEPELIICGRTLGKDLDSEAIGEEASKLAKEGETRERVNSKIAQIAGEKDVLVEGRDIGTKVLPNADLKIYLDASIRERARRRKNQRETELSVKEIEARLRKRDERDQKRKLAPLKPAEDAVIIDTTSMSEEDVVERLSHLTENIT